MAWKCPNCNDVITELRYSVNTNGSEYGTAQLNDTKPLGILTRGNMIDDYDYSDNGDSEWSDDPVFECDNCNEEVDVTELIWIGEGESDEEKEEKEAAKKSSEPGDEEASYGITRPEESILDTSNRTDSAVRHSLICKSCRHVLVCDREELDHGYHDYTTKRQGYGEKDEFFVVCTKCNHINSTIEFERLLKDGYFNQINKNDNAKNIRKNNRRSKSIKSRSN